LSYGYYSVLLQDGKHLSKMVRYFFRTASFNHPWRDVTSVFWSKFPNKYQPYIKSVDTFDRDIDSETSVMTIRRMVTHNSPIPN